MFNECLILYTSEETDSHSLQALISKIVLYFGDNVKCKHRKDQAADKEEFNIKASDLTIINSHIPAYWQWTTDRNAATAVKIKWLEVRGSFSTTSLWPDHDYKVLFLIQMEGTTEPSTETMGGKEVSLKLSLPHRDSRSNRESWSLQEKQEKLPQDSSPRELEVGRFTMKGPNAGTMHFAMEGQFQRWSGGLVIKGAMIKAA